MIDLQRLMSDTDLIRDRMFKMWDKFDEGEMKVGDARVHVGFARATLDAYKVKIAAMHHLGSPSEHKQIGSV